MDESRRDFTEVAVFPGLGAVSVGFAFEVSACAKRACDGKRSAFRLVALSRHLESQRHVSPESAAIHDRLIEPVRSFLDDVTNGAPGVNGRPLLLVASGAPADDPGRCVTLVRPSEWDYEFEGETTRMAVPDAGRRIPLMLRDSVCVFESGRIYYVLSLVQCADGGAFDEYALLQLEQLSLDPELALDPGYVGFEWGAPTREPLSLVAFVNARLARLNEPAPGDPPSAVADLLRPYGLLGREEPLGPVVSSDLVNLCIGIEDERVQRTAAYAHECFDVERGPGPRPERHPLLEGLEAAWDEEWRRRGVTPACLHRQPGNAIERGVLAVAGLATGVPDFPFQDDSEVHDSTRLTAHSVESALYTHPRFMLEVGRSWRSFREGLDDLGTCPYLFLTWMVSIHDEQTVSDMEHMLEDLIYDPTGRRDLLPWNERSRAEPLADVMQLLSSASSPWGQKTGVQERNLKRRLEIFRWESIHRCGNMFRYPKEKAALNAVREAMGVNGRFEEVHATLDRLENLVEDVATLASAYSERRTNRLLGALALLGLLTIPKSLADGVEVWNGDHGRPLLSITMVIAAALLALYFVKRSGKPED